MSNRHNNGSSSGKQQQAAELHNKGQHSHDSAAQTHDKQDHLTDHEQTRRTQEHTPAPQQDHEKAHHATAAVAHEIWQLRGCPEGTAEEDWFNASKELKNRKVDHVE